MLQNHLMEDSVDFYWDLAVEAESINQELSASYIHELLETLKHQKKELPPYTKKLFCLKCFSIFHIGENCKVTTSSCRKHPNTKFIEYHCLKCKNTQRINVQRQKIEPKATQERHNINTGKPQLNATQKKRKLLMNIFK